MDFVHRWDHPHKDKFLLFLSFFLKIPHSVFLYLLCNVRDLKEKEREIVKELIQGWPTNNSSIDAHCVRVVGDGPVLVNMSVCAARWPLVIDVMASNAHIPFFFTSSLTVDRFR